MAHPRLGPHERLAAWRRVKRLTLATLSKASGIGISSLSEMQNGKQHIRADHLEAIVRVFGLTMAEFYDDALLRRMSRANAA